MDATVTEECQTCEWAARRDRGEAPMWDAIVRTPSWDVVHASGTSLLGWIVLVVRRHIESLAELSPAEAAELGPLIAATSRALADILDAPKTYVAQFAEHPRHPHVHVHVIPRAADLPDAERGPRVFAAHLGVPSEREVPESTRNAIADRLRRELHRAGFGGPGHGEVEPPRQDADPTSPSSDARIFVAGDAHVDRLLEEQRRYYRERALEYDDWWERRDRYDAGPEQSAAWRAEIDVVADWLARCQPGGEALELAAGTGNWTRRLAPLVDRLLALDASPETLAVAAAKLDAADLHDGRVQLRVADVFALRTDRRYDTIFFSFWLTHVPDTLFESFWTLLSDCLAPGGQVLFADNAAPARGENQVGSTLDVHYAQGADDVDPVRGVANRTLADGRTFRIVKRFWQPDELASRLAALGWHADVETTARSFLYGRATPA